MIGLLWYNRARKETIRNALNTGISEGKNIVQLEKEVMDIMVGHMSKVITRTEVIRVRESAMVICPNCGRPNNDKSKTCWKCGARLK